MFLYSALLVFLNWIWGLPMLLFLGGGGVILTISVGFVQCTKFGYVMRHTFGKMFEKADKNGISGFQAVSAALSSTIGTGNIVGVGAAIAMGGPGAVFWMWLIGFVAMATKYCEVIASVKYREPNPNGGWFAGPYMYIRKGLGNTCFSKPVQLLQPETYCFQRGTRRAGAGDCRWTIYCKWRTGIRKEPINRIYDLGRL